MRIHLLRERSRNTDRLRPYSCATNRGRMAAYRCPIELTNTQSEREQRINGIWVIPFLKLLSRCQEDVQRDSSGIDGVTPPDTVKSVYLVAMLHLCLVSHIQSRPVTRKLI